MPSPLLPELARDGALTLTIAAQRYLAIIDPETYPAFVAPEADYLDLVAHLSRQMRALTAVMWETPTEKLNLRVAWTEDHRAVADLTRAGHRVVAEGWVKSAGRLALASHERLLAGARERSRELAGLGAGDAPVWEVPPGIYAVTVFAHHHEAGESPAARVHYDLVLRRYPHPARRVAPVRVTSPFLSALEAAEPPPPGAITSHARIW